VSQSSAERCDDRELTERGRSRGGHLAHAGSEMLPQRVVPLADRRECN
jgi:hypothetical protein